MQPEVSRGIANRMWLSGQGKNACTVNFPGRVHDRTAQTQSEHSQSTEPGRRYFNKVINLILTRSFALSPTLRI